MPFFSRIKRGFGFNRGIIDDTVKTDRGEGLPTATDGSTVTGDCNIVKTMHPPTSLGKENNFNRIDNSKSTVVPKKTMEASELLAKHARLGGTKSPGSSPANAHDEGAATYRGRRGSDMKYSSISPPTRRTRVPSARTISDQCFLNKDSSSASSPESSLADRYDEQFESYTLDENEASPESRAIMEEMEQIYQSSPIPESYLNSPPKKLQLLPEIVLRPNQTSACAKQGTRQSEAPNKGGGAEKSQVANGSSATRIAEAKAAYGGPRRNSSIPRQLSSAEDHLGKSKGTDMNVNRRRSTAPNDSRGISDSHEWGMPSEKAPSTTAAAATTTTTTKKQPLAVQREEEQRNQRVKDAMSSSNERDGRRNLDKRTARLRFGDAFKADIMQHRQRQPYLNNGTNHSDKVGSQIQDRGMNGVSIAVRKRPMFDYELDRGDYDVVSIDNTNARSHDVTIVHNCVMHADMKRMYMKPTSYPVTAAFDEHCCDDDVYRHIAEPLVIDAANDGVATILMYGQTGCGKSHTMSGIETRMARGLFKAIDSKFSGKPQGDRPVVTIQFVELCGSKVCNDLLVKKSGEVKLVDAEDGSVHLLNATLIEVTSPEELLGQIMLAKGRRATEATDMNGVSSRSHAVCQIEIKGKQPGSNRGLLTLIDCAGSERSHDSMYHSR
jgi:kinesin family protein 2/24